MGRDDISAIFHPQTTNLNINLSEVDLASAEPLTFDDADIFIQNIHAACCRPSAFSISASPASERASAIAACLIRPLYAAEIAQKLARHYQSAEERRPAQAVCFSLLTTSR
jgi:hypothetical protein